MFLNAVGISLTVEKARDLATLTFSVMYAPPDSTLRRNLGIGQGQEPYDGFWPRYRKFLEENGWQLNSTQVLNFMENLLKFIELCKSQEEDMELRTKQKFDVRDNTKETPKSEEMRSSTQGEML